MLTDNYMKISMAIDKIASENEISALELQHILLVLCSELILVIKDEQNKNKPVSWVD